MRSGTIARDEALGTLTGSGISGRVEPGLVVSLTSYPARMGTLHHPLGSILGQTLKPDAVMLWLAEEEFPGREADIPNAILALRDKGLTIRWTTNVRSYKKLVPALKEFQNSVIVTADDDFVYRPDWLERLTADYENNQRRVMVYAHRAHRVALNAAGSLLSYSCWRHAMQNETGASFLNFATTGGGCLFPPGALHPDVCREERFLALAPHADDVWFWAMAVLNGTRTRVVQGFLANPRDVDTGAGPGGGLYAHNVREGGNDVQLAAVLRAYPEIAVHIMVEQKVLSSR